MTKTTKSTKTTKTMKTMQQDELAPVEEPAADFVLDLLAELRARHFRPRGWLRFFLGWQSRLEQVSL